MSKDRKGMHAQKLRKEVDNSMFSFIPQEKRKTAGIIALIVIAIALVLVVLTLTEVIRWDGHLPVRNGKVQAEDNVVTVNKGTSGDPKFFAVGKFAGTGNYALDPDYAIDSQKLKSEWKYDGKQADPIYLMQIFGNGASAKETYDTLLEGYAYDAEDGSKAVHGETGEDVTANGLKYYWLVSEAAAVPYLDLYYYYGLTDADYYQVRAFAYIETSLDSCAVIRLLGRADEKEDAPGTQEMRVRLSEFADRIYAEDPAQDGAEQIKAYIEEPASDENSEATSKEIVAGYFIPTDKYALSASSANVSANQAAGWSYAGDKGDPIYFMYVAGVNNNAKAAADNVKNNYSTTDDDGNAVFNGTVKQGTNANGLKYYWTVTEATQENNYLLQSKYGIQYPDRYIKYSYAYVETTDDACVMVAVYAQTEISDAASMPSDDALFERALEFIDLVDKP